MRPDSFSRNKTEIWFFKSRFSKSALLLQDSSAFVIVAFELSLKLSVLISSFDFSIRFRMTSFPACLPNFEDLISFGPLAAKNNKFVHGTK